MCIGQQCEEVIIVIVKENLPFYSDYATMKCSKLVLDHDKDQLIAKETGETIPFKGINPVINSLQIQDTPGTISERADLSHLNTKQKQKGRKTLEKHSICFGDLRAAKVEPIQIPLKHHRPIRSKPRHYSKQQIQEITKQVKVTDLNNGKTYECGVYTAIFTKRGQRIGKENRTRRITLRT